MKKVPATFEYENSLWTTKEYIVGIDEVGRGAWAGPLVSAAVIFPKNHNSTTNFFDSKMLLPLQREKCAEVIKKEAVCYGFGEVAVEEISNLGLTEATQLSYTRALENLSCIPDHYLIDAFYIKALPKEHQTPIIGGDRLSATIAAASIIAKVFRDNLMTLLDEEYSGYSLLKNKGYGTKDHQQAISKLGLSKIHRDRYNLKFLYG